VIVKEKLLHDWAGPDKALVASGIGSMIKPTGFDPEHGDWEYFYADETTPFSMGKLKSCAECHAKAKHDDHLLRVRDLPEQVGRNSSIGTGGPAHPCVRPEACYFKPLCP